MIDALILPGNSTTIIRSATRHDRAAIICLINTIAGERRYFRTLRYTPTSVWEQLLAEPSSYQTGLLLAVEHQHTIIGYGRMTPPAERTDPVGDIGLGLLRPYRSRQLGTALLHKLVAHAPQFGFHKLSAAIFASNERSLRLFMRHNFKPVAAYLIDVPFCAWPVEEILVERHLIYH